MPRNRTFKQILFIAAIIFFLLGSVIASLAPANASTDRGGTVEELKAQQEEKRRKLLELKNQVNTLQKQINEQHNKIASLNNEISLFDLQIEQTKQQIQVLNAELELLNLEIIDTLNQITATEAKVAAKKELLRNLLLQIYAYNTTSPLEIILSQNNFSDVLNQFQNTITYQDKNQQLLNDLHVLKAELAAKQSLLESKKKNVQTVKAQAEATQASLEKQQQEKERLLAITRNQEHKYKELLDSVSEEEARVSREVYELDLAIRQKRGDRSLPPSEGLLAWPMEGILTQGYGNTGFTRLGYNFHNGIDVAAPANTSIHAAADGIVEATGSNDKVAYGRWVAIRHSLKAKNGAVQNIITIYAHLNRIMVSPGKAVLRGDVIGLEGNTGNTTRLLYGPERGYHLHFMVLDAEDFGIKDGAYTDIYGPYKVPYGYPYNPMSFLK